MKVEVVIEADRFVSGVEISHHPVGNLYNDSAKMPNKKIQIVKKYIHMFIDANL
jgi:hypothetical protein